MKRSSLTPPLAESDAPRVADFAALFVGDVFSVLGTYFNLVAVAALTFSLSRSVGAMSLQVGAASLTGMVVAPWAGRWADRTADRRRPMLLADVWRATLALALAGAHQPWQVAVIASLAALGGALYAPARGGLMVQLAGRERIARYNGWRAVIVGVSRIAGPLLAGAVIAHAGVAAALALNAAGYAISAIATLCVHARPRRMVSGPGTAGGASRPHAAYAWTARDAVARGALVVWGWVLVGTWCVNTQWFVWVQAVHFGGPAVMGAAIAAYEGGSMVAGAALVRLGGRAQPWMVSAPAAGIAVCWCALALAHSAGLVVALSLLEGIGAWWLRLLLPTILMQRAPDEILGAVLAVEGQVDSAGRLGGVGLAAAVGRVAPAPGGFLVAAAVVVAGLGATVVGLRLAAGRQGGAAGRGESSATRLGRW